MYDVPSRDDIARVVITGEVVRSSVNPTLVPREAKRPKRAPREKSA
jgi:ATP-dependent Clp protease ATP-binding subunit ClpX